MNAPSKFQGMTCQRRRYGEVRNAGQSQPILLRGRLGLLRSRLLGSVARTSRRITAVALVLARAVASAQTVLPVPQKPWTQQVGRSAAQSGAPVWPSSPTAPKGAPNILLIMTDDVGFGASSTFGGPIPTPTFDALAKRGACATTSSTPPRSARRPAPLCSPAAIRRTSAWATSPTCRQAMRAIPASSRNRRRPWPRCCARTAMAPRCSASRHLTPEWEQSQAGPFDRWPTGLGFEYFYGFLGGDTSQCAPALVENTTPVEPPHDDPDYHLRPRHGRSCDRLDRPSSSALAPDKPFFVYYAPGAAHTPHHAPKEWLDEVPRQVRSGLGQGARGDLRPPEGDGRHPGRCRADAAARRPARLGYRSRRPEAALCAADGGLCRLARLRRCADRPRDRRACAPAGSSTTR